MPFSPPPPSYTYFHDYVYRHIRGLIEAEWRFKNKPEYKDFSSELNSAIQYLNELRVQLSKLKHREITQKTYDQ